MVWIGQTSEPSKSRLNAVLSDPVFLSHLTQELFIFWTMIKKPDLPKHYIQFYTVLSTKSGDNFINLEES